MLKKRTRHGEADDRLRVGDVAGRDDLVDTRERDALDDEVLLLDPVRGAVAGPQPLGEEADGELVAEPGRVVEVPELGETLCLGPDLLGELARRALFGRLAGHVELAGRKLQERLVDRAAVLAHEQDVLEVVFERDHAHGVEGPHDLALEGEAVGADEGADDDASGARPSTAPSRLSGGTRPGRLRGARRGSLEVGTETLALGLRREHCRGRRAAACARAPG